MLHGISGRDPRDNLGDVLANGFPFVGRHLENRELSGRQVLLVAQILVRGDEEIVFLFGQTQKVAVFKPAPTATLRTRANVADKVFGQRPRDTLVEDNPHAARSAASESSRTWQAISLVTDGKHSRNSSRL